jgi:uracil-DNA glycosylase
MIPNQCVSCALFPCVDVQHSLYTVPTIEINPAAIRLVMVSEAAPAVLADYYYAGANSLFAQTTVQAFVDAGANVHSIQDLLDLGVYLTTAVKCAKTGYGIQSATVKQCSLLLEQELALFPHVCVLMLMGDVAIKSLNYVAARCGEPRVIPAGATYKLRGAQYGFRGARVFPSYLQAGPSFFIEKSKRRMIAEDIAAALDLLRSG